MGTDSRKIQLEAGVNTTGAKADLQELKTAAKEVGVAVAQAGEQGAKGLDNLGAGAAGAGEKLDRATASMIGNIQRQTAVTEAGERGTRKYFEALASQRGVDLNVLKPYLDGLDAVQKKSGDVGISAKQTAAALRGVPAQFTDIVTSLQGGQAPLTVLLQQGGQLKDMFGGAGEAAKGLGKYIGELVSPTVVILAAAGGLALLFANAGKEMQNYNKALILSGNSAGATAGQLQVMGQRLSAITGSQSAAAEALAEFAQAGAVAAVNLEGVTASAIRFQAATGTAISDTVKQFTELRRAPLEAAIKLNEATGFLTTTLYEQIKALNDQGRATEAADLAQRAFSETINARSAQIRANVGTIESAWLAVKAAVLGAGSAIAGIGKAAGPEAQLAAAQAQLTTLQNDQASRTSRGLATGDLDPQVAAKKQLIASLQEQLRNEHRVSEEQGRQAEMVRARIAFDKDGEKFLDKQAEKEREITKARNEGAAAGASQAEIEARIANIREQYKEKAGKAYTDDAGTRMLQNLRESESSLRAQLAATGELTGAQRQLAEFEQKIADIKTKGTLTAEQKSLLANQDLIRAQLEKNAGIEKEIKLKNDGKKLDDQAIKDAQSYRDAALGIQRQAEDLRRSRTDQYDRSLSVIGLGSEAREQVESTRQIFRDYDRLMRQNTERAADKGQLGSPAYEEEVQKIKGSLQASLKDNADYYSSIRQKQGEWVLGASAALADYESAARNTFASTYQLATGVLGGLEDAFVTFAKTGKISFKSLADSFIADLARMEFRAAASTVFKGAGGALGLLGSVLGAVGGTSAQASAASAMSGDSLDNFINLSGIAGRKAAGGPTSAGGMYEVTEGGRPELLNVGSRTYLMMGNQSGSVTPAGSGAMGGGGGGGNVYIENHGADVQPQRVPRAGGGFDWRIVVNAVHEEIASDYADRTGPLYHAIQGGG